MSTTTTPSKPSILLVDTDEDFLLRCQSENKTPIAIVTAQERKRAQLEIADKKNFFAALCFCSSVCDPLALPLIRFSKAHRPSTPVYILDNNGVDGEIQELAEELRVEKVIGKPVKPQDLINTIFPYTLFEMEKLVNLSKEDPSAADSPLSAEDDKMHAISARDFLCGSKSFFDVYVRLGTGKYIKLLRAGDQFDAERVKSYLAKGVTSFYMKKEAQELFLQYCDKLTEKLLSSASLPAEVKVAQVMNFGKETMDYMKTRGFNEMTIQTAHQFVKHAGTLAGQLKSTVLDGFMSKVALADHGSGTLMILSMLIEQLGYRDRKTTEVIALGGLFHDIGLMNMPEKFQNEEIELLSDGELTDYKKHPQLGEAILKDIRRMNPLVPQVVLQHHERRTRDGFPLALGPGAISPVSEMIGISETFNQLIRRAARDPSIDPAKEIEKTFDAFSFPVM